jgi:hypothetical protein
MGVPQLTPSSLEKSSAKPCVECRVASAQRLLVLESMRAKVMAVTSSTSAGVAVKSNCDSVVFFRAIPHEVAARMVDAGVMMTAETACDWTD